jgi:hypothetical protein
MDAGLKKARQPRGRALSDEELAELVQSEVALIEYEIGRALGPNATQEQKDAMAHVRGHSMRLGAMLSDSPETRARGTVAGRTKRWSVKPKRDEIIDAVLRTGSGKRMKILAVEINKELERRDLKPKKPVTEGFLNKRKKTLHLTDEPKIGAPSD